MKYLKRFEKSFKGYITGRWKEIYGLIPGETVYIKNVKDFVLQNNEVRKAFLNNYSLLEIYNKLENLKIEFIDYTVDDFFCKININGIIINNIPVHWFENEITRNSRLFNV